MGWGNSKPRSIYRQLESAVSVALLDYQKQGDLGEKVGLRGDRGGS